MLALLRLRDVGEQLAIYAVLHVAFPTKPQGRHVELVISELNTRPTCASVNASPRTLPPPAHDSRPEWLARPSPYDSFIRYSMPVYPGAFGLPRACVGHNWHSIISLLRDRCNQRILRRVVS